MCVCVCACVHACVSPRLSAIIKMAAICGGYCTDILWRGYRFAMTKNISDEEYIQSSNANAHVLLNLSILAGFIIPDKLVLDDCIMPHLNGFDFL